MKIVANIIMKDESRHIGDCIRSLRESNVDEIWCLDTGSKDDSREIAITEGAKLYQSKWQDFSTARNFLLRLMERGDWVVQIDADERCRGDLKKEIDKAMTKYIGSIVVQVIGPLTEQGLQRGFIKSPINRLYRAFRGLAYTNLAHEEVISGLEKANIRFGDAEEVFFIHHGYDIPFEDMVAKMQRNKVLLLQDIKEGRDTASQRYHLAQCYQTEGNYAECIDNYKAAILLGLKNPLMIARCFKHGYKWAIQNKEIKDSQWFLDAATLYELKEDWVKQ